MLSWVVQLLWLVLPLAAWLANGRLWGRRLPTGLLFLGAVLVGYAVLLAAVRCTTWELRDRLHRHDLNGDGVFDEEEETPEMRRAMDALCHDTGRALAPFTGGPITAIWTGSNFGILALCGRLKAKITAWKKAAPGGAG